jgi:histone deacetylase 1/2
MSLFLLQRPEVTMYLLVYVDDIILVSSSASATDHLIATLSSQFSIKDLGKLHYFLGLEVSHHDAGLTLTQEKYSLDLLRRVGMLECKVLLSLCPPQIVCPHLMVCCTSVVGGL